MASHPMDEAALKKASYGPITDEKDNRIIAAKKYV